MEWYEQLSGVPAHELTEKPEPTGAWENAEVAFGEMRRENLPVVSPHYLSETKERRYKQMYDYIEDGNIPQDVADFYFDSRTGLDMDGLSMYARNELGIMDIPTPQDYEKERNEEYADYRKHASEVYNAQTKWGMLGEFAGKMAAIPTDPLYAISFFTGYGSATTVLQAFARVGAMEMAIEGVAQVGVKNWKDEVGSDYGGADMLVNTLSAGLLGGGLGAAGKGVELKVGDALKALDALAFKSPEAGSLLNPVRHVLKNTDPELTLRDVVLRDEGIERVMNERGSKAGADPEIDAEVGFVDRAEQTYAQKQQEYVERTAQIETYKTEARDRAMQSQEALDAFDSHQMDEVGAVFDEKIDLVNLKKELKAGPKSPESDMNLQIIEDQLDVLDQALKDKNPTAVGEARDTLVSTLRYWTQEIDKVPPGVTKLVKQLDEVGEVVKEAPATRAKMKTDAETIEAKAKEVGSETQLPPEPNNPISKQLNDEIVDTDAKWKKFEEDCKS